MSTKIRVLLLLKTLETTFRLPETIKCWEEVTQAAVGAQVSSIWVTVGLSSSLRRSLRLFPSHSGTASLRARNTFNILTTDRVVFMMCLRHSVFCLEQVWLYFSVFIEPLRLLWSVMRFISGLVVISISSGLTNIPYITTGILWVCMCGPKWNCIKSLVSFKWFFKLL